MGGDVISERGQMAVPWVAVCLLSYVEQLTSSVSATANEAIQCRWRLSSQLRCQAKDANGRIRTNDNDNELAKLTSACHSMRLSPRLGAGRGIRTWRIRYEKRRDLVGEAYECMSRHAAYPPRHGAGRRIRCYERYESGMAKYEVELWI